MTKRKEGRDGRKEGRKERDKLSFARSSTLRRSATASRRALASAAAAAIGHFVGDYCVPAVNSGRRAGVSYIVVMMSGLCAHTHSEAKRRMSVMINSMKFVQSLYAPENSSRPSAVFSFCFVTCDRASWQLPGCLHGGLTRCSGIWQPFHSPDWCADCRISCNVKINVVLTVHALTLISRSGKMVRHWCPR